MGEIQVRASLPQDVDQAVPLIIASGPDAFNYVFTNKRFTVTDFLKHVFVRKGGEFGFDNHYTVLLDQKIIGIGSVFSGKRAKRFIIKDFLNIVRVYKLYALPVMIRGLRAEQIIKLPLDDELCLAHLAIDEKERGKGYGEKLIRFLMAQVDTKASHCFVLDVSEENPKAQKLYERIGFQVQDYILSSYRNDYGHVPNHFRMNLEIEV